MATTCEEGFLTPPGLLDLLHTCIWAPVTAGAPPTGWDKGVGPLVTRQPAGSLCICGTKVPGNQTGTSCHRPIRFMTGARGQTSVKLSGHAPKLKASGHKRGGAADLLPGGSTPLVCPFIPAGWRRNVSVEQWKI